MRLADLNGVRFGFITFFLYEVVKYSIIFHFVYKYW